MLGDLGVGLCFGWCIGALMVAIAVELQERGWRKREERREMLEELKKYNRSRS